VFIAVLPMLFFSRQTFLSENSTEQIAIDPAFKGREFSSVQLSDQQLPKSDLAKACLTVSGMRCAGCVSVVEKKLLQQEGVQTAAVNLVTGAAEVSYQADVVSPRRLVEVLTEAGFASAIVGSTFQDQSLPFCAKDQNSQADNPSTLSNTGSKVGASEGPHLQSDPETQEQLQRLLFAGALLLLSGLGHLGIHKPMEMASQGSFRLAPLTNALTSSLSWLTGMPFHWLLATIALVGPGQTLIRNGWRSLRHGAPDMNTLVGIGTLAAYITSTIALLIPQLHWECFFDEPVMLVGFVLLGRTLEQQARNRAKSAFSSLLALQPQMARVLTIASGESPEMLLSQGFADGITWHQIPIDQVPVGGWLQVKPGEQIPIDGLVRWGQGTVDESMLTGESTPVLKQVGDWANAGTLNQSGVLVIEAARTHENTTLARIIRMVSEAQMRKAPVQRLADQVAGYFTYTVLAIAVLTFSFWALLGTHWFEASLLQFGLLSPSGSGTVLLSLKLAISVLVVACPCALGLATPTALLVGSSLGAEHGLIIRGSDVLEKMQQVTTIVFDKTGTLTQGQPTVTDCLPVELSDANPVSLLSASSPKSSLSETFWGDGFGDDDRLQKALSPRQLLQLAASVEQGTQHPLAIAIHQQAQSQNLDPLPAEQFHTEPGLGIAAQVQGRRVVLGNLSWVERHQVSIPQTIVDRVSSLTHQGKSIIYVAVSNQLVGILAVTDQIRADARAAVLALRDLGLEVKLLTGDQATTAQAIARQLDLKPSSVLAEVLPDQKASIIRNLQASGQQIAMVGDGINDVPALAEAHVGISLQCATDAALEAADIVLTRSEQMGTAQLHLMDVVKAIHLSRATLTKIRQNLFWAFTYNLVGIPVAAGLLLPQFGIALNPAIAAGMMAISSVCVVTNSLLLRTALSR